KNCVRTTNYWAFMLFKPHRGKMSVRVETDGPKLAELTAPLRRGETERPPELSISATRQGGEMIVTLVNPRHDTDMDVDCTLRGVTAKAARAEILHDSGINAFNSFDQPERVMVKPFEVSAQGDRLRATLPAMSIA